MPRASLLRDDGTTLPLWVHVLLITFLAIGFYLYLLSFPLHGEDGAFNYMSLLQRLNTEQPLSLLFGFKLIDGLGQPNLFWTIAFDPFSWPMLLVRYGRESAQNYLIAFQLTMALRLAACWLATYLFATAVVPGARTLAVTASYLSVLLAFFLARGVGGTINYSGTFSASQTVLLPLALGLYVRGIRLRRRLFSLNSAALFLTLLFLIMTHPIGSFVATGLLIGIGVVIPIAGSRPLRRWACLYLLGLVTAVGVILFFPGLDVYASWQAGGAVSSRIVFSRELTPYFLASSPPLYWYAPPIASRLIAACAVASLLVVDRVPPMARAMILALTAIVGGIQFLYLLSSWGLFADLVRPLPPLSRIETYIPHLYALSAAVALCAGKELLVAKGGWRFLLWCTAAIVLSYAVVYMFFDVYRLFATFAEYSGGQQSRPLAGELIVIVVLTTLAQAFVYNVVRLFAPRSLPGSWRPSAAPLGMALNRATFGNAAVCCGFIALVAALTAQIWATKPYFLFPTRCDHVTFLGCRDMDFGRGVNAGDNPIVDFLKSRLASSEVFAGRAEYLSPYDPARPERADMIAERERNFRDGGNGMMLASLPFNGIPVASTYEQSHDYLYYLFWTRYLMQDAHVRFSPNWTALYQFRPDRLALAGVRDVVTRADNRGTLTPAPIVFAWRDFVVAELDNANIKGYGVTRVDAATTLSAALARMRSPDFEPQTEAVLSDSDLQLLPGRALQPVASSEITTRRQVVRLLARSAGKASLIVLPFRFSHCWTARWNGPAGTLLRADVALLALYFEGEADVSLEWTGGYGSRARCLEEDASLIDEAQAAGRENPY
jgi:hypothetical protein